MRGGEREDDDTINHKEARKIPKDGFFSIRNYKRKKKNIYENHF
jgi:hypothetical protein